MDLCPISSLASSVNHLKDLRLEFRLTSLYNIIYLVELLFEYMLISTN